MRIAICTPVLMPNDAVSNDVIGMYHALRARGYETNIFSTHSFVNSPKAIKLKSIREFISNSKDVLLYHHSVGWNEGIKALKKLKCHKVVKYHNVTPYKYFEGFSKEHVDVCKAGRKELQKIARLNISIYLSDSQYNAEEVTNAACREICCNVLPPFHQVDRLKQIEADKEMLNSFKDGNTNILMVGRVVPNKGYEALIDVFGVYHWNYNQNSRLLIVGKEEVPFRTYSMSLRSRISHLHLDESVLFLGEVSDMALKSLYLVADVFMTTSSHEGFCVPLVEAMSMRVPIVAYGSTAIPGTVGKVGLVWDECDPDLMAASVDRIIKDETIRLALCDMGWNRYNNLFSNVEIEKRFIEVLENGMLLD